MILAGGRGSRLKDLTNKVAKPAVSFGGKYRIVDFPLSNCANSGINIVGVLTQYEPVLLNSYVAGGRNWGLDTRDGGVFVLPPREKADSNLNVYRGTADAITQNIDFIDQYDPEYVLVLSGDQKQGGCDDCRYFGHDEGSIPLRHHEHGRRGQNRRIRGETRAPEEHAGFDGNLYF